MPGRRILSPDGAPETEGFLHGCRGAPPPPRRGAGARAAGSLLSPPARLLRRALPAAAVERVRLLRDLVQLRRADPEKWAGEAPAYLTQTQVTALMEESAAHPGAWQRVAADLRSLGIHEQTGGVNPGDRRALHAIVARLRPASILEVGTHIGASTITLAASVQQLAFDSHVTTVDIVDVNCATGPWRQAGLGACPQELLSRIDASHLVDFHTDSSHAFLAETPKRFELVFLDGSHTAAAVYRELPLAFRHLAPGGWIVLHDYFPHLQRLWKRGELIHGPWLAAERLRREGTQLNIVPFGELPWPTKGASQLTSLAALARR